MANIKEISNGKVFISTEFGCIYGTWCSSVLPSCKTYDIELDSKDVLTSENCYIEADPSPRIFMDNDQIHLCGFCECCEDSVLFVRLGHTLIMLEYSTSFEASIFLKQYIHIILSSLEIWDTGIL